MKVPRYLLGGFLAVSLPQLYAADVLLIDFESASSVTQDGWISFPVPNQAAGATISTTNEAGDVGISLTPTGGGIFNSRGGEGGRPSGGPITGTSFDNVQADLMAARNGDLGIDVEITGLEIGTIYTLTTFHNDSGGNAGFAQLGSNSSETGYEIALAVTGGATQTSTTPGISSNVTGGARMDDDFSPGQLVFEATATTVTLTMTSDSTAPFAPVAVSGLTLTDGVDPNADDDMDGLPNQYEVDTPGLDPNDDTDATGDLDNDMVDNLTEFQDGTDPNLADTDGDGLDDLAEKNGPTDALDADSDDDFFLDGIDPAPNDPLVGFINNDGLFVDFSSVPGVGQVGTFHAQNYQTYFALHESDAANTEADPDLYVDRSKTFSVPAFSNADVTLAVSYRDQSGANSFDNTVKQMVGRGASTANYEGNELSLIRDWIGIDPREGSGGGGTRSAGAPTTMDFTFTGLPAGVYRYRGYHHDTQIIEGDFEIEISDSADSNLNLGRFRMTHSSEGAPAFATPVANPGAGNDPSVLSSTIELVVVSNGSDPVVISYIAYDGEDEDGISNFSNGFVGVNGFELISTVDSDGDRIPDAADDTPNTADGGSDADMDNLTKLREYNLGTDPNDADSDDDMVNDGDETFTDFFVSATDAGTSPFNSDSDGDTFTDGAEIAAGSNPLSADSTPENVGDLVEISSIVIDENLDVIITFVAQSGRSYRALATDDLTLPLSQWIEIANGLTDADPSVLDTADGIDSQFYIIQEQ